ncbi:hypothetical protein VISI1226_22852 [Vibrio sinaloensis DSM 21326]|uniref:DUF2989 domain-containing protein n=1 Tax=Vibrio sinaloensis DSM 21326 TaxID=945550 RepID=E8MC12_PHOS4|nr:DUF2989 domain-containing protein [Vibrio sinaloensis]EGA68416.1 hypothetical protein VISI1226_22852 [Vibrio sinaloensis DSM 21326]
MKKEHALTLGLISLTLVGCFEPRKNTEQLCEDNPALQCQRLNMDDGQCRVPRTDLIWHRFEVLKNPTPKNHIKEYELLAEYKKCLELASQILAIDQTELKQRRFSALVNSGEDLEKIVATLSKSTSPEALYFLWSRVGNEEARRAFLQLEGTPQLDTAEMQYALATFYTSRDQQKTKQLLLRTLELTNLGNINNEVFKSLASTTYRLGQREEAYVWAMIASNFGVPIATEQELQLLYGFDEAKYKQLEQIADQLKEAIETGSFKKALVPQFK